MQNLLETKWRPINGGLLALISKTCNDTRSISSFPAELHRMTVHIQVELSCSTQRNMISKYALPWILCFAFSCLAGQTGWNSALMRLGWRSMEPSWPLISLGASSSWEQWWSVLRKAPFTSSWVRDTVVPAGLGGTLTGWHHWALQLQVGVWGSSFFRSTHRFHVWQIYLIGP